MESGTFAIVTFPTLWYHFGMNTLAHLTRGQISESRHAGYVAIADSSGRPLYTSGPLDEDRVSFMRSAAKPLQAIPLLESGAADRFGLSQSEIAMACASHGGQPEHVRLIQGMLDKGDLKAEQLLCGAHYPYHEPSADELKLQGLAPTNLHSNCSGKHAGMLLVCKQMGWPTENYTEPEHPLQQAILAVVADFTGLRPAEIATGVDGCSVVCFGMTTVQMATAFARLAEPGYWLEHGQPERAAAITRITEAMWTYPFNVGGTGRGDTDLMESASAGQVFSKVGAEAVWCMGFPREGLGLAMKVEDGGNRAEPTILAHALRQVELISPTGLAEFEARQVKPLRNVRNKIVGHYQATFELRSPDGWNDPCC